MKQWFLRVAAVGVLWPVMAAGGKADTGREPFPPTADYEVRKIAGWTVRVHKELLTTEKDVGARAIRLLEFKLERIVQMVPSEAVAKLRQIPIWLSAYDRGKRHPCACYHPSVGWLRSNGYNPDKAGSVDIANAKNFLSWTKHQYNMVLHELAHGYHHRFLPGGHSNAEVRAAFEKAKKAKSYESVVYCSGGSKRAYALNNPQEYLAEATEAMYGTNDFYPFVRIELKEHDPAMFELLRKLWGEPPAKPKKPARPKRPAVPAKASSGKAAATAPVAAKPAGKPAKAPAAGKPRYTPTDQYVVRDVEGWRVYFHPDLARKHKELDRQVLRVLGAQLHEVARKVPPKALAKLRTVKIWMEYKHWRSRSGGYHPSRGWLVNNGYNPDKTDSVEFARAEGFVRVVRVQPSVVLHELAHAWHDQFLPGGFGNKEVRAAYEAAKGKKRYESCLLYTGRRLRAYAMTNPMEYFAELSEAYFGTNDFFPFVGAELKNHDPEGYKLLRKLWGGP